MNEFDPDNITKSDMTSFANGIEAYLNVFTEVMVIPKEIEDDIKDDINDSIKVVKELIKKLRKGDSSVFKDPDEWNSLY